MLSKRSSSAQIERTSNPQVVRTYDVATSLAQNNSQLERSSRAKGDNGNHAPAYRRRAAARPVRPHLPGLQARSLPHARADSRGGAAGARAAAAVRQGANGDNL